MAYNEKIACVFGGSGFVGHQVVRELAAAGYRVKIASRVPERAFDLKPCGQVGQIVPFPCDYSDEAIGRAVQGCDAVINLVGVLYEKRKNSFKKIHTDLPQKIAKACAAHHVPRFVHLSALACDKGSSCYAKSKFEGEKVVLEEFPAATILRPGIIFGPGDGFFQRFADMAQILPALPLIGGGQTKIQPVYVGDVADAVMASLRRGETAGNIYALGGPEIYTFKEIYALLFEAMKSRRCLVNIPYMVAKMQGMFLSLLPRPPLTADQVESLKTDNVVDDAALTLKDLGISPSAVEVILPTYLRQYYPGGRFYAKKRA